jgi:hypothetical protein
MTCDGALQGHTPRVCTISIGVFDLRARGCNLRRGYGPGQYAFVQQATDGFTGLERIEPEK